MRFYFHLYHEVAGWASHAGVAFLRNSEVYAIINTFRYVYRLFDHLMDSTFASTWCAWVSDHFTDAITIAADLLYHKRSLSNRLKPCTSAGAAFTFSCAWFGFGASARAADVGSSKLNRFLCSVDRIHKIDFDCNNYIFAP